MSSSANLPIQVLVEVVADSVASAVAAERAGAGRIELCCAIGEGGLTPSLGTLAEVVRAVRVPVFAMVRPRRGDFLFDAGEFRAMRRDLDAALAQGAHGIVTGMLDREGRVDRVRTAELVRAAGHAPVTFHRAFDLVPDGDEALEALVDLGIARLLTSGQAATAEQGLPRIAKLVARAAGRLCVMAGAGVRTHNAAALVRGAGVRELHLSASRYDASPMRWPRTGVAMGTQPVLPEDVVRSVDEAEVRGVVRAAAEATLRA